MCRAGEVSKMDVEKGSSFGLMVDGIKEGDAYGEGHCLSTLSWAVREAARDGKGVQISPRACARLAVELNDPYGEEGEPALGRPQTEECEPEE